MIKYRVVFLLPLFVIVSCNSSEDYFSPKPRGYFRLTLPEKEYFEIDTVYPFRFEIPEYAQLQDDTAGYQGDYWFNLTFPQFEGVLHFSYKPVNENLYQFTEDTRTFVYKHVPKAEEITTTEKIYPDRSVYGLVYHIDGVEAASPTQFYITDSTRHFLRGALYFEHAPNNDSLQPVIDFINQDIYHLLETIHWK